MLMNTKKQQSGLSLVELMVGLLVGLFVVGGVLTVYLATVKSSNLTLKQSRLNQEMAALMNIMVGDIRRAGYWEIDIDNDGIELTEIENFVPQNNPFTQMGSTALDVRSSAVTGNTSVGSQGSGPCIVYAYDATYRTGDNRGTLDNTDLFGFRYDSANEEVDMRLSGDTSGTVNDCTNGTWQAVTDNGVIRVTALNFNLSESKCINSGEPDYEDDDGANGVDDDDELDCYTTAGIASLDSEDKYAQVKEVLITLSAELVSDDLVKSTMQQSVRVRNEIIVQVP